MGCHYDIDHIQSPTTRTAVTIPPDISLSDIMSWATSDLETSEVCEYGSTQEDMILLAKLHWWLEIPILLSLGLFGICANLTALPVLLSRQMANVFNQTLAILAIFDTFYIILDMFRALGQNTISFFISKTGR